MRSNMMSMWILGLAATFAAGAAVGQQYGASTSGGYGSTAQQAFPVRGRVAFRGTHRATVLTPARGSARRGPFGLPAGGTRQEFEGALTIVAEIDGAELTLRISGTGGVNAETLTGLIQNGRCRAMGQKGAVFEGQCGPAGFNGTIRSGPGEGVSYRGSFATTVASVEDYAVRDRERAAGKAKRESHSEAVAATSVPTPRQAAAAAPFSRPASAGSGQHALLHGALQAHAADWLSNRLDTGSLRDVRTVQSNGRSRLRGDYTYNGGLPGWVEAEVAGGRVKCLQFWDTPDCETVAQRARVVAGTEAYQRGEVAFEPVRNRDGAVSGCLERADGGNSMRFTETRNGYGDLLRTDSYATGGTFRIRNKCGTGQTYTSAFGNFDVAPKSTITLKCDYHRGENGFGQMVTGGITGCYKVGR